MIRAACIGECMVELRPAGPRLYAQGFAGDAFNTAAYLARELGDAGEVSFLTVVGDDPLSVEMAAAMRAEGVDDRWVFPAPGATPGLYLIELDAGGDRTFHYWRSASAARGWMRALEARGGAELLAGLDLVYLSGVSLAILDPDDRARALALMGALRGRVGMLAFDPNVRPRLWPDGAAAAQAVEAAAAACDVVLPSTQDGEIIWGERDPGAQLSRWRALGAGEAALTLAADGARVSWIGGEAHATAPPITAVDTSGGGDSFNGAYLAARLKGAAPDEAARVGVALAARVVARPGALVAREAPQG